MALTVVHPFVNPQADEPGFPGTKPSDWNASHTVTGLIDATQIPSTAVTAGSYTYSSLTVGADGRLTAAASGTAPITDHGLMGGLTDDDHSQYLALAGRTPNQNVTGSIGFNCLAPNHQFEFCGDAETDAPLSGLGYYLNPVRRTKGTIALAGVDGNVDIGTHYYGVTYVTAVGESGFQQTTPAFVTTVAGNKQVTVGIPVHPDPRVTGRKIYRNKAGEGYYAGLSLLATINNNTDTTYTDNIADASLSGDNYYYKTDSTCKYLQLMTDSGTYASMITTPLGMEPSVTLGQGAGSTVISGTCKSGNHVFIGASCGAKVTTGAKNTFIGGASGANVTIGEQNVIIGSFANYSGVSTTDCVIIGGSAEYSGTDGYASVTIGRSAHLSSGSLYDVSIGSGAAYSCNGGRGNTCVGMHAGYGLTDGRWNTVVGAHGFYSDDTHVSSGWQNIIIGAHTMPASATANYQLCIGNFLYGTTLSGTGTNISTTARLGLGVKAPSWILSLYGESAQTIGVERTATAATAGKDLTVNAGGAVSGGTDKAGGCLILAGGISTGSGESGVEIRGAAAGAAGAADRTPATMLQVLGNKVGMFGVVPVVRPTALTTQLTTITHTAPGAPDYAIQDLAAGPNNFGFVTKDEGNTVLSVIANLQTRVSELETKLQALGALT